MNYVLSIVLPPEGGAAFGKAMVFETVPTIGMISLSGPGYLFNHPEIIDRESARLALQMVGSAGTGSEVTHKGVTFRIDPADRAPNACPCCGRLVLFGDHALAGSDDAYCLGCFTWKRGMTPCLPENTAHTEEP